MSVYSFWNNKGGVGKSFLSFIAASEYANRHKEADVYVIDLCPQANVSETLLGGFETSAGAMHQIMLSEPRRTVAGYLEARLNSPFKMIEDASEYVIAPKRYNGNIPENLYLVCGDNLLELLSEAIRQTSQLAIPVDSWKRVVGWIRDLILALRAKSGERDSLFIIDCNPSFAIYTQLALAASDSVVVPFTADDSSRRAIENVVALLYGVGEDARAATYARISFAKRAKEEGVDVPKLHTFVSNRVTLYEGSPSKAFKAASKAIKDTLDTIHSKHRQLFSQPKTKPSEAFVDVPDYHSACIVAATTGTPLHRLKPGPRKLQGERVQINKEPLDRYRNALEEFVENL